MTLAEQSTSDLAGAQLRVLIANERADRLSLLGATVIALGHQVVAQVVVIDEVGPATAREHPDVALVGIGASSDHALALIDKIVHEAKCPVIILMHEPDPEFVMEASSRGVFAHISDDNLEGWDGSIDIVLRRFGEYHALKDAFGRRAVIEQAKGILMERHDISDNAAFEILRTRSRTTNRRLIQLATSVVESRGILPGIPGHDER